MKRTNRSDSYQVAFCERAFDLSMMNWLVEQQHTPLSSSPAHSEQWEQLHQVVADLVIQLVLSVSSDKTKLLAQATLQGATQTEAAKAADISQGHYFRSLRVDGWRHSGAIQSAPQRRMLNALLGSDDLRDAVRDLYLLDLDEAE
jgi:hypothetical protein